jgi:hypothetical protein
MESKKAIDSVPRGRRNGQHLHSKPVSFVVINTDREKGKHIIFLE